MKNQEQTIKSTLSGIIVPKRSTWIWKMVEGIQSKYVTQQHKVNRLANGFQGSVYGWQPSNNITTDNKNGLATA